MKRVNLFLVYLVSFIYMEFLYKVFIYGNAFRLSNINMIFFLVSYSIGLTLLTRLFKSEKKNFIVYILFMSIISIWFSAQFVLKDYFDFYLSFELFHIADQVANGFIDKAFLEIFKRLPGIIMFFIPLILGIIFRKKIIFDRFNRYRIFIMLYLIVYTFCIYIFSLNLDKDNVKHLYYEVNDINLNMENFGVINTFNIDLKRNIFGFEHKLDIIKIDNEIIKPKDDKEEKKEIIYDYNNLEIDFDSLIQNESNNKVKEMHKYFENDLGTKQNEYTNIFKDKNLIIFMAESFNEVAVNEKTTPTLYKLINSGFTFKNFYTPTIYSTIGGEFQELTGLYAESVSTLSKFRSGNVNFTYGIGNVFKDLNYKVYAYHNNSYVFQDRHKYLKSLGFDQFSACYNGLEKLIDCKIWPPSDVDMINATINDYINDDNFMVFYATVSGHAGYSWGANAEARKHKDEFLLSGINVSEGPASYMAAQMELDKSLELLIQKLEESGKLDDTVIALVGDHYPYELSLNEVNEISSFYRDAVVGVNKSNFILWNNKMNNVVVEKVGSQIDIIPTIYNAFGIKYDSRTFIGKDILSTEGGLAIFANRSWVSDYGIYYSQRREFVPNEGVNIPDDYVSNMNKIVNNRITMSKLIIDYDYYKYIK